jgi:hypothetical protein
VGRGEIAFRGERAGGARALTRPRYFEVAIDRVRPSS